MIIAVVGAGPAGLMAAYAAATSEPDCKVLLFDKNPMSGKKLIRTGSGKGNIGNEAQGKKYFHGSDPDFPARITKKMSLSEILDVLREIGVYPVSKDGYLYPGSFQAKSVRDAFDYALGELPNVKFLGSKEIIGITKSDIGFELAVDGWEYEADKVILCCGGLSAPDTGSDGSGFELCKSLGHTCLDTFPALVPLAIEKDMITGASGDRVTARVTYGKHSSTGELQITDYGISGIVVFQISRYVSYDLKKGISPEVTISFLPEMSYEELDKELGCRSGKKAFAFLMGLLPEKLAGVIIKKAGFKPDDVIGEGDIPVIWKLLRSYKVKVNATLGYDRSQVTAGGIDTREIDPNTFMSDIVQGLYICGEMLDVDGDCGGYNLQWAFTSGYIAGKAASDDKG